MVKTIGNPLTWATHGVAAAGAHAIEAADTVGSHDIGAVKPRVNRLGMEDLLDALKLGYRDFAAARTDVQTLCIIYPVIGLALAAVSVQENMWHLLFPLIAGFALIAPAAAVGFYEISRRREKGEDAGWTAALQVMASPSFGAVLVLCLYQILVFAIWLMVAHVLYAATLGTTPPTSFMGFVTEVLTTGPGWTMIVLGTGIGFLFALTVLATSVVSFPMLLDRRVGLPVAVTTSVEVFRRNPRVIATWGLIVTGMLVAGSIPLLTGLVIVLPLLGHATWHLYRRAVSF